MFKMDAKMTVLIIVATTLCCLNFVHCEGGSAFTSGAAVQGSNPGSVWPKPRDMTTSPVVFTIDKSKFQFAVATVAGRCDILQTAFQRYSRYIFGPPTTTVSPRSVSSGGQNALSVLYVTLKSKCQDDSTFPTSESDEFYNLTINHDAGMLYANEVWGALRGLETFSQLVYQSDSMYYINKTEIEDQPRFKHRGLMLDTSRHYLSKNVIMANLDLMAMNKFNVFHWHIVDDQSFPYQSVMFPEMSDKGAYNKVTHIYTQNDIKEIIEYARERGIRVIPEFDTPGHTQSWGKSIKNLLTKCYSGGQFTGIYGPIDPSVNSSFTFLQEFFKEVTTLFKDHYVHLGGDEVSFDCWATNVKIIDFMKKMGFGTDYAKLEEYYMQNLIDIVNNLQRGYLIWQEVIDNGAKVANDTIVHVWKGDYYSELHNVTKLGYEALLSSCWYINYIGYGAMWKKYYACDPQDFNGSQHQKDLVMGGEACIWGEYVDDTNILPRLWPSASAVAERLWSQADVNDSDLAAPRLEEHRCRMVRRGYPVEPSNGPSFCDTEYVYKG